MVRYGSLVAFTPGPLLHRCSAAHLQMSFLAASAISEEAPMMTTGRSGSDGEQSLSGRTSTVAREVRRIELIIDPPLPITPLTLPLGIMSTILVAPRWSVPNAAALYALLVIDSCFSRQVGGAARQTGEHQHRSEAFNR